MHLEQELPSGGFEVQSFFFIKDTSSSSLFSKNTKVFSVIIRQKALRLLCPVTLRNCYLLWLLGDWLKVVEALGSFLLENASISSRST